MRSRMLQASYILWAITPFIFMIIIIVQSIEVSNLEVENAKYINEIEYLKGSNDLLQEDNLEFQDALWHYHDMKNKEMAE